MAKLNNIDIRFVAYASKDVNIKDLHFYSDLVLIRQVAGRLGLPTYESWTKFEGDTIGVYTIIVLDMPSYETSILRDLGYDVSKRLIEPLTEKILFDLDYTKKIWKESLTAT